MFVTQKMILVDLLVLKENIEEVSELIVKAGYFEPTTYSAVATGNEGTWMSENTLDKKKLLSAFQKDAQDIKMYFDPRNECSFPKAKELYPIPKMGDTIRQYVLKMRQLEERARLIKRQKEDVAVKIAGLKMHNQSKAGTSSIFHSKDLYSILGLITVSNLAVLQNEFHRFEGELLNEGHVNDFEIVFITIPLEKKKELDTLLEQLYFVNYGLPDEFHGEGIKTNIEEQLQIIQSPQFVSGDFGTGVYAELVEKEIIK